MTEAMLYERLKALLGDDYIPDLLDLHTYENQHGERFTDWRKVADHMADYLASKLHEALHPVAAPDATGHP